MKVVEQKAPEPVPVEQQVEALMRENALLGQQLQQSRDLLTIANRRIGQHLDDNVQLELRVMALTRELESKQAA